MSEFDRQVNKGGGRTLLPSRFEDESFPLISVGKTSPLHRNWGLSLSSMKRKCHTTFCRRCSSQVIHASRSLSLGLSIRLVPVSFVVSNCTVACSPTATFSRCRIQSSPDATLVVSFACFLSALRALHD